MLENIPKPVLWGGGALIIVLMFMRSRSPAAAPPSTLDATLASMQLAAASNIEALGITSQRDVALAGIYTDRMAIAEQSALNREKMALDFMSERDSGRRSIRMASIEHRTMRIGMNQHFQVRKIEERNERRVADQNFRLTRQSLTQDFKIEKMHLPKMFEVQLRQLENERQQTRYDYDIQTRRLDMMQMSQMGYGPGTGGQALGLRDASGAPTAAGAIGGAATGAMAGAAMGCMATGAFTFGLGCAASMAAGAAAGGSGGMS